VVATYSLNPFIKKERKVYSSEELAFCCQDNTWLTPLILAPELKIFPFLAIRL
jgi:hypothetical protein